MPATLLIPLLLAAAEPAPNASDRLAEFERLMAAKDYSAASRVVDDLAMARPADTLRPDPLLSGLEGRMLILRAPPSMALAYLQLADSEAVPAPQRIAALFALAEAREAVGDRAHAAETYRRLLVLPLEPGDRGRAALGLARAVIADAPGEAAAAARKLTDSAEPGQAWEAELIVAEASLLSGDRPAARAAADRAWTLAAEAPARSWAPLRTALVRAAIADRAGEREPLISALGASAAATKPIAPGLEETLPVCGAGGVRSDDWVTFAAFGDAGRGQWLTPVAASRVAAAAPFTDAIGGAMLFADRRLGGPAGGSIFTARCRTAPSDSYHSPPREPDPWAMWFASRGLLFPLTDGELADINRLSGEIEELARARPDDPRLIPLRLALSGFLRARAAVAQDVEQWQVTQLDAEVKAGMRRLGGLDGFLFELWDLAERIPRESIDRATALAQIRAAFAAYLARAPLDMAYEATFALFAEDSGLPPVIKREWLESLSRRFAGRRDDPRRTALLLMLVDASRDEAPATARAAWRQTGLPDDLCAAANRLPSVAEHHIDAHDFPRDLFAYGLSGTTVTEFGVDAAGHVTSPRILLSVPSSLFDATVSAKLPGFEMKAGQYDGKPKACRGFVQRVLWKLPDAAEPGVPVFVDPDTRS